MAGRVRCRYCGFTSAASSKKAPGRCPKCMLPQRRSMTLEEMVVRYLRQTTPRLRG
jgi:hypothetical protein